MTKACLVLSVTQSASSVSEPFFHHNCSCLLNNNQHLSAGEYGVVCRGGDVQLLGLAVVLASDVSSGTAE